ncbi:MAG: hypothetical protein GVY11_05135 [Gammaproteobacteria bacterium]|jgi:hypothetical protein|nr:hypothetical protein [Gammaproteobacteria bacterium]
MIRKTLLACVLVVPVTVAASERPAPLIETETHVEIARWMLEQPGPEMRATALVALAENQSAEAALIEPDRFLEEAEALLADEPSAAVAYMLASGCLAAGLVERCESIGVLDAVERFDGGNPIAAGVFQDAGSAAYRDMLIDAAYVDDHYPEYLSAWFEALRARSPEGVPDGGELIAAVGIAMAVAVPSMQELMETCRAAVGNDEQLDEACQRLSEQMRSSGRTIFLRNMGYGLARQRAEALGDGALAEQLRERNLAVSDVASCLPESANAALHSDVEVQRRFLADMRADGEVAAFQVLLEQNGSRCEE